MHECVEAYIDAHKTHSSFLICHSQTDDYSRERCMHLEMSSGIGKRKHAVHEWDVSEVEESHCATVHGVVTNVSPVKASHQNPDVKYFDGRLTDWKKSVRVVFRPRSENVAKCL